MKFFGYLLSFFLFFLFNPGCKKDNSSAPVPDPPKQFRLNPEGLKYIQLSLNKYFIYKDSATGVLDSVVVTKSTLENVLVPAVNTGYPTHPAYYMERYSIVLTKMNAAGNSEWFNGVTCVGCLDYSGPDTVRVILRDPTRWEAFYYPIENNDFAILIGTITLEGSTYNNVIRARDTDTYFSTFYWAKGVGIIKLEKVTRTSKKTYTLLRHG